MPVKKKRASLVICFRKGEPVGAVAVWGVFWWCDAQGAVDGEQVIVRTVKLVVHTFKDYKRQCLNKTVRSQNRDVTNVSVRKKPFCTDASPDPFSWWNGNCFCIFETFGCGNIFVKWVEVLSYDPQATVGLRSRYLYAPRSSATWRTATGWRGISWNISVRW